MIQTFEFNHFQVNCYVLYDEASRQCAIIDPAAEASYEDAMLTQFLDKRQLMPTHVLLTHPHIDHVAGLRQVCEQYGLPVSMHKEGLQVMSQAEVYGNIMGFAVSPLEDLDKRYVEDGDVLMIGGTSLEVRHVPGHCPGSVCYVAHEEKSVFTGDALFHFSIGRTDLPGGDYQLLIEKIKTRLLTLPDDYAVLPGHGISSTIGKERRYNQFLV